MAEKRKAEVDAASETVQIIPLGAGQEVGRSCIILKYMGKSVMLDCGTHPGLKGSNALPLFDGSSTGWSPHDLANLDLCLVTHFHIDHCGCVPFLVGSTNYKGRVIMTHPTKVIYYTMMKDSAKTRGNNDDQVPINDQDVEKSMERISVIDFHQTLDLDGIRITAYRAGHVLGAAMFLVEIAGMRCLYTGDYSWVGDRHLPPADVPESRPDIVIIESTFGTVNHRPRREREQQFCRKVREVVTRGGRCLLPVVALGRAQELLLILEDHWKKHSELRGIPLYQTSALARRTLSVYQTFIDMMNNDIKQAFQDSNPFNFKYVQHIKSAAHFDDVGPCVVLATPSMMDSGMSRDLFEAWCEDPRNGVIIADFAVQGTLAHKLLAEPETHLSRSGQRLRVKCSVSSASFSAHADYHETASFLDELKPPHVVLVHGEREGMLSLKSSLEKNGRVLVEKGLADVERQVYMPGVLDTVEVQIPPRFRVRAVGKLAEKPLAHGRQLQGVVLQPGSQTAQGCLLVAAPELPTFTTVRPGTVRHRQAIATRRPFGELRFALEMVFEGIQGAGDIGTVEGCGPSLLRVADAVDIVHQPGRASDGEGNQVVLEWEGGPSDVFADAVIAVILQPFLAAHPSNVPAGGPDFCRWAPLGLLVDGTPARLQPHEGPPEAMSGLEKQRWAARQEDDSEAVERIELQMLVQLLRSQFGEVEVMEESRRLWLVVDSDRVLLDHKSGKLQCVSNPQLLDRVDRSYRRFLAALHPVTLEPED